MHLGERAIAGESVATQRVPTVIDSERFQPRRAEIASIYNARLD